MDHTNPSSSSTRTLGDFLPETLREAGSDRDSAPPLNDSHFPSLGVVVVVSGVVDEEDGDKDPTGLALVDLQPGSIDHALERTSHLLQLW